MPTKPKPDVRFILDLKDDSMGNCMGGAYFIATLEAAICQPNGELTFPQYRDEPGRELVGLVIRAQLDRCAGDFYGFRPTFKPYEVTLENADSMLKVLRRIDKRTRELAERFGYPRDLAAYMGHIADALGADHRQPFCRRVTGDSDMSGTGYRWMDVDYLRDHLATAASEWRTKHGYTITAAA